MNEKLLTNSTNKKDNFISFSAFVCAIMIVGIHAFNAGSLPLNSLTRFIESVISHGMFTGAVPIFMFTSSYLFYRNITSVKDCFSKQKKRVISVAMPFFAWSTFYYITYAISNHVLHISMTNSVDISFWGIFKGIVFYEYCFPLWFLWQLMIFVIISPLIFWILSKKKLSVIVWAILVILGFLNIKFELDILGQPRIIFLTNYFAYYFTGALIAQNNKIFDNIKELIHKTPLYLLLLLYIVFSILGGIIFEEYLSTFNNRCIIPFIAISLWALLYKIYLTKKNIKVYDKISTMIIYAIHPIIGVFLGEFLSMLPLTTIISYFIGFVLCVFLSCLASIVLRFIKPLYWVFSGNR